MYGNKREASFIRSQLAIRFNKTKNTYEVYTTVHGSGVFRWIAVSAQDAQWYREQFPAIKEYGEVDA